jgi:hypothetical protein
MKNKKYLESLIIHNVYGYESKFGIKPSGILVNQKTHDFLSGDTWSCGTVSKIRMIYGVRVLVSNYLSDGDVMLVV